MLRASAAAYKSRRLLSRVFGRERCGGPKPPGMRRGTAVAGLTRHGGRSASENTWLRATVLREAE